MKYSESDDDADTDSDDSADTENDGDADSDGDDLNDETVYKHG